MAETVIIRGEGGGFLEVDVPPERLPRVDPDTGKPTPQTYQREIWEAALAKGTLSIVDPATVEVLEVEPGVTKLIAKGSVPDSPREKAVAVKKAAAKRATS